MLVLRVCIRNKRKKRKRIEKLHLEKEFKEKNNTNVYYSDDYAGLEVGKYSFYFGYEVTVCPKHKNKDCEDLYDCDLREWAFQAKIDNKVVMTVPASELWFEHKDVLEYLLLGIGKFLDNQPTQPSREER